MNNVKVKGRELFYLERKNMGEFVPAEKLLELPEDTQLQVLQELHRKDQQFFNKFPIEEFSLKVEARVRNEENKDDTEKSIRQFPLRRFVPLLAAAMLAAIVGFSGFFPTLTGQAPMDQVRIKGMEPTLNIYRAEENSVQMLEPRARAEQYDLLQLEYNGAGFPYGLIFSIDGYGTVTLHYPAGQKQSPKLESGAVLLPYSYQLDDAPDFERFFFVVSSEYFDSEQVLEAAERLSTEKDNGRVGKLSLPKDFVQASVIILKEDR